MAPTHQIFHARRARLLFASVVALVALGVFAATASADSPNPLAGTTTATTVYNADGSRTVTVSGQFEWTNINTSACGGVDAGFNVAWGDNNGNPLTAGGNTILVGVLNATAYDAADNTIHDLGTCGTPNAALGHNSGNWGPISHTYLPSFTGAASICPVLYHDKGGANSSAGGTHADHDNSFEDANGAPAACAGVTVPALTTQAGTSGDTATLSGSNAGSGSITFTLFDNSTCSGSPVFTSAAVPVSGDGSYASSPSFTPSTAGTYHWVASYSGDSNNSAVTTACSDPAESVSVSPGGTVTPGTPGTPPAATPAAPGGPNVLPAVNHCVDTRKFTFRLHRFRKARIIDVVVFVNGKRKVHKTGRDITKVSISKLPQKTFTVTIVTKQSTGSTLTSKRKYKGCKKGKPTTRAHHVHPHH